MQVCNYLTILTARRVLAKHPEELVPAMQRIIELRNEGFAAGSTCSGPGHALHHALRQCGASLQLLRNAFVYNTPEGDTKETLFIGSDTKKFQHELREAMRARQWVNLASRRHGFEGIQFGVDRAATGVLQRKVSGLQRYQLRCCMTGAVATKDRLFQMGRTEDDLCVACGVCTETWPHIVDDCPSYDHLRYRDLRPTAWHDLPDCLRLRGLAPLWPDAQDRDAVRGLVGDVQYVLLDMLELRNGWLPENLLPQPRWQASGHRA